MQKSYDELFFQIDERHSALFNALLFDMGIEAIEEKDGGFYVRSSDDLQDIAWALQIFKDRLENFTDKKINFSFTLSKKENKDWIQEYKNSVQPIEIDRVYIHSSWHKQKENFLNIQINPALAFGSGHHESTNSCVKFIQKYAKSGYEVLDVGCGSGILSILLAKLSCIVDACDVDDLAIKSTKENLLLNSVKLNEIWCGSLQKSDKQYDLIIANLTADIIKSIKNELNERLKQRSYLILSGILNRYEDDIKQDFSHLKLVDSLRLGDWSSLVYQKENLC
ncbi:50S ribosomal protein L11 methyltransferase [uncultured Campylobacter sp.]|uniref:50S ribosomal protein L11 methyltransferase n=1 Tax=uncultured Campylobacter sp. TaxID=218934 RepID=UPI00262ED8AC|nr:50S ribosomal protein L11 methyltransferase [uncultured Campylobacter sp.]